LVEKIDMLCTNGGRKTIKTVFSEEAGKQCNESSGLHQQRTTTTIFCGFEWANIGS